MIQYEVDVMPNKNRTLRFRVPIVTYGSGGAGGGDRFLILPFGAPTAGIAGLPEDEEDLVGFVNWTVVGLGALRSSPTPANLTLGVDGLLVE